MWHYNPIAANQVDLVFPHRILGLESVLKLLVRSFDGIAKASWSMDTGLAAAVPPQEPALRQQKVA